jgi:RNA polymerase sigma-70 factor (ECF subfamily)
MHGSERERLARAVVDRTSVLALYARQWVDDLARAEDVVQQALTSLLTEAQAPNDPVAWMYRAVRNAAIDHARSESRRRRRERVVARERGEWFDTSEDAAIDGRTAEAALQQLPPQQREIVVMRVWGGLRFAQIAELVGLSVSSTHDRYTAALAALRAALEKPCVNQKTT